MKFLSSPKVLVVGALSIGIIACGSSAPMMEKSPHLVGSPGPEGPAITGSASAIASSPLPPDAVEDEKKKEKEVIEKGILARPKLESDIDLVNREVTEGMTLRGTGDPLSSFAGAEGGSDGAAVPPGGLGVASNAKGPNRVTGGSGTSGTNISAATEVRGSIDKAEIQRVVRTHINDVKRCYDQGLMRRPDLEGKVVLKFTIGKTGTVIAAIVQETTLNERQVEQCISSAALRWLFPKPTGEGLVVISYPFILKSAN